MMLSRVTARAGSAVRRPLPQLAQATFSSVSVDKWAAMTVSNVATWDTDTVVRNLTNMLGLDQEDVAVLKREEVNGKMLLGLDERKMERAGLSWKAIEALLPLCAQLTNTGPKTVRVNLDPLAGEERIGDYSFKDAEDFEKFLNRQGAVAVRNGDKKFIGPSQYSKLKEGGLYTIDFAVGGFKSDVLQVKQYNDTTDKATVESCKHAVATQSNSIFNTTLKPQKKTDDGLKMAGVMRGDVDILFKSDPPGLHVLLELKRRIPSAADALDVITQVGGTAAAYKALGRHIEGRTPCDVKSMVFAEAIAPEAVSLLRGAGIYVLSRADMRVLSPTQ